MKPRRVTLTVALALAGTLAAACDYNRRPESRADVGSAALGEAEHADALLAARLQAALANDPITRDAEVQVSVAQRRVRLSGFVDSAAAKLRAGVLAAQTDGVEAIDNRLIQRHHAGIAPAPLRGARVHL